MFSSKMAAVISYLIGVALFTTMYFVVKQQKKLPEKKVFGFPLSKMAVALSVYFLLMAIFTYFK